MRTYSVLVVPTVLLISLLLLGTPHATAQLDVVPTDVQLSGTQPNEVSGLQSVNKCDNCHGGYDAAVEPAGTWRGSLMAHATRDPIFWATVAVAEQDFPGSGDLCIRCHTPDGWLGGRSTPTDGSDLIAGDLDGVSCDACHRMTNPDTSEWQGVQNPPFLAHDGDTPPNGYHGNGMFVILDGSNTKLGPYADAVPNHGFLQSTFHRSSDFCGTCHDVSNPVVGDLAPGHGAQFPLTDGFSGTPGAPVEDKAAFNNPPASYGVVERTYSEHMASGFPTMPVADMPSLPVELQQGAIARAYQAAMAADPSGNYVDGTVRTFTCQSCHMPPVDGAGSNKPGSPVRSDLPHHDLTGGNTWIPQVILHMDALDQLVIGGGLTPDEQLTLAAGVARARANLQDAAALTVDGDTLRVINLTGHKLLSGYPEGRRMWLRTTWRDDGGNVLRVDGEYGALTVLLDGQAVQVQTLLAPDDPRTHQYVVHQGMTQEWAARLLGWGWDPALVLGFDRTTGEVTQTLGALAAALPGSAAETFHFVLNDTVLSDHRIPPYGFRYDEARVRNTLPVPATLFGNPGPGGEYQYWDEVQLDPPPGATTATIELLYQTTSWEYVQFLYLANDGSVALFADIGEDFLQAWFALGMSPPELMTNTTWSRDGLPTGPAPRLRGDLPGHRTRTDKKPSPTPGTLIPLPGT
jgi:hypothetical protein